MPKRLLLLILCKTVIFAGCGSNQKSDEKLTKNDTSSYADKSFVIYDSDSRTSITDNTPKIQSWAKSVVALVTLSAFDYARPLKNSMHLCESEKFASEKSLSFCTGSLISPNTVLTAGHCMRTESDCQNTWILLDYDFADQNPKSLKRIQCKKILKREYETFKNGDYAVFELAESILDRNPLEINQDNLRIDTNVVSISHPLGIPKKIDFGKITELTNAIYFKARVDTFQGSSGSPILDTETGKILGILSRGSEDFDEDQVEAARNGEGCVEYKKCSDSECYGELFFNTQNLIK